MPVQKKAVNIRKAINDLVLRDMSMAEAGKLQDVSASAICQQLHKVENQILVDEYITNRANIYAEKQSKILFHLNDAVLKRITEKQPGAAALWFNSLYNNERLERGQATEIHDTRSLNVNVSKIDVEIRRLEGELMRMQGGAIEVQSGGDEHE